MFGRPITIGQFGPNVLIRKTNSFRTGSGVFDGVAAHQTSTFKYRMRSSGLLLVAVVVAIVVVVVIVNYTVGFVDVTINA